MSLTRRKQEGSQQLSAAERKAAYQTRRAEKEPKRVRISKGEFEALAFAIMQEMKSYQFELEQQIMSIEVELQKAERALEDNLIVKIFQVEHPEGGMSFQVEVSEKAPLGFKVD